MRKTLIIGTVIFSLVYMVLLVQSVSFAQLVPHPINEQSGLTILDAKCAETTATSVSGMSCRIRNDSSKEVAAFTVLWIVTTASGKTFNVSTMEDKSLVKSLKRFAPGEITKCESSGAVTSGPGDSLAKVEAVVDYILFSDGSTSGRNKTNTEARIRNRQLTGDYLRGQFLKIYQEKGLDALLVELENK
jgi:hypothetical protein